MLQPNMFVYILFSSSFKKINLSQQIIEMCFHVFLHIVCLFIFCTLKFKKYFEIYGTLI